MTGWVGFEAFYYSPFLYCLSVAAPYMGIVAGACYYAYAAGLMARLTLRNARRQAVALAVLLPAFPLALFIFDYFTSRAFNPIWVYFLRPETGLGLTATPWTLVSHVLLGQYQTQRTLPAVVLTRNWIEMASAIVPIGVIGFNTAVALLFWRASRIAVKRA